jgi:glycosyltransferase involved in cell wall biosynthesis
MRSWACRNPNGSAEDGSETSLNVVHIAAPGPFGVGGLESVVVGLALGLHRRGAHVTLAAVVESNPDRNPVIRTLRDGGVRVHPIVVPHRAYLRERRAVRRLFEAERPDIVHTHGYRPDLLDSGIARGMGIPTVTTIHGSSLMSWRTAVYEAVQFRLLRRFQAVVAVSRPLVADLRRVGVPPDRIRLVPNAWDGRSQPLNCVEARRTLGLPLDAFVVGWVGRLIPVKGCDVFLRAVSRLRDPSIHASIIGSGPEQGRLQALVAQHGLRDRVHFHGCREGAANLFRAFDVWVLSSRSEGTPMVLFEAMAAGVPIVASAVGGVGDAVSEAEACLVPPEDPDALAGCLQDIHSGRLRTQERVAAARARLVEHHGTEQWVERYAEVYRELLDGRQTVTSSTQTC